MKQQRTFKIGELSRLFNIGTDSIRYYEEVGILTPKRNPENNYRIYTIEDVQNIVFIRELLYLGFTTDQIRAFTVDRNLSKTMEMFQQQLDMINEQIKTLKETKQNILSRLSEINHLLANPADETIQVQHFPARPCVMVTDENSPDNYVDYYVGKYIHHQKQQLATIGMSDCYTLDLEGSNPDSLFYRTKNVFFYSSSLDLSDCNYELPEGEYLTLFYSGSYTKTKKLLPKMFQFAKKNGFEIIGDPIEFCHIDNYETNYEAEYMIELEIPAKKVR